MQALIYVHTSEQLVLCKLSMVEKRKLIKKCIYIDICKYHEQHVPFAAGNKERRKPLKEEWDAK